METTLLATPFFIGSAYTKKGGYTMEAIPVKATLVEKISKTSGKPYKVLEIQLTNTYVKSVFLEKAELELLALNNNDSAKSYK